MRETLSIARAKARFAESVRRAEAGEVLILTRHGRPVARLAPIEPEEVREAGGGYETAHAADATPIPGRAEARREALERLLAESVWPRVPSEQLGKAPDRRERDEILGLAEGDA